MSTQTDDDFYILEPSGTRIPAEMMANFFSLGFVAREPDGRITITPLGSAQVEKGGLIPKSPPAYTIMPEAGMEEITIPPAELAKWFSLGLVERLPNKKIVLTSLGRDTQRIQTSKPV